MRARLAEMERLTPGRGAVGGDYWNEKGKARRFSEELDASAEKDPVFRSFRRAVGPRSTVVDVGAGTGRFSLALSPRVHEVVAVDPSRAMLGVLRGNARQRGLRNVRAIESQWENVPLGTRAAVPRADVVICAFVLPFIAEAEPFVAKMDAACTGRALVAMNAASTDALSDPFWRHFHGAPRRPTPTYLDLRAMLVDLGLEPEVEILEVPTRYRFESLETAAASYRDVLVLPDTAEIQAELQGLMSSWLVRDGSGLRPPERTMPVAIVSWTASSAAAESAITRASGRPFPVRGGDGAAGRAARQT